MGRKIPGKKHRGIKDPEKQRVKRLAELKLCTNMAPKNADEQAIPKSLERIIKLKEAVKTNSGILKRKQKKKALISVGLHQHRSNHPNAKPEKVVPVLQQRPGESGKHFMHRVSRDTHNFLKEVAFERKYSIQIERDSNTGEIQSLTKCKCKNEAETLQTKHKNINRKKKIVEGITTLTKNEKRKLKRAKKKKKLQNHDEFERLQDKVVFGEVAHEPPRLKIKSKKMNEDKKPKNLLLNSLLEGSKEVFSVSK